MNYVSARICDLEIENRVADRESLPKRHRYYTTLTDSKQLPTSEDYIELPEYISITISSYDPFLFDDMYYEAKTCIVNHPEYDYNDGVTHIFLYTGGKVNTPNKQYGEKLHEMLEYMVSGEKPSVPDNDISNIDKVVTGVKTKAEVTKKFMRQWEIEIAMKREARDAGIAEGIAQGIAEGKAEAKTEAALNLIRFAHDNNIDDEAVCQNLRDKYAYTDSEIESLVEQALNHIN